MELGFGHQPAAPPVVRRRTPRLGSRRRGHVSARSSASAWLDYTATPTGSGMSRDAAKASGHRAAPRRPDVELAQLHPLPALVVPQLAVAVAAGGDESEVLRVGDAAAVDLERRHVRPSCASNSLSHPNTIVARPRPERGASGRNGTDAGDAGNVDGVPRTDLRASGLQPPRASARTAAGATCRAASPGASLRARARCRAPRRRIVVRRAGSDRHRAEPDRPRRTRARTRGPRRATATRSTRRCAARRCPRAPDRCRARTAARAARPPAAARGRAAGTQSR